jgi:rod shape-determining protein MreD
MIVGSVTRQVETALRMSLPVATVALAALLDLLPALAVGPTAPPPGFLLCCFYYWTVYRPELLPPAGVFVLGLAFDLAGGLPPGMTPLVLLTARALMLAREDRILASSPGVLWLGFVATALVAGFLRLLIASLWWAHLFSPASVIAEAVLGAALFPLVAIVLAGIDSLFLGSARASGR